MEKIMTEQERAKAFNEILNPNVSEVFIKGCSQYELKQILEHAEIKIYEAEKEIYRFMGVTPVILEGKWGVDMESYIKDMEAKKPQAQGEEITEQLIESEKERFNFFAERNNNYQAAIVVIQIIKNTLESKPETKQETEPIKKPSPTYEEIISKIKKLENKFWKGLPMEMVIKHFEVMTTHKSSNGEPYLTQKQFISFLKRGFLNDGSQPKQKINCSTGEKGKVLKKFWEFYDLAKSKYWHPAKTERFINLFTDCFDNWEPDSIKDLFKPYKTRGKI